MSRLSTEKQISYITTAVQNKYPNQPVNSVLQSQNVVCIVLELHPSKEHGHCSSVDTPQPINLGFGATLTNHNDVVLKEALVSETS